MLIAVLIGSPQAAPFSISEAELSRQEACVYGAEDVRLCGDFAADIAAYGPCVEAVEIPTMRGSAELSTFLHDWSECEIVLPCSGYTPAEGETVRQLRYCQMRRVAASRVLGERWLSEMTTLPESDKAALRALGEQALEAGRLQDTQYPSSQSAYMARAVSWNNWLKLFAVARAVYARDAGLTEPQGASRL